MNPHYIPDLLPAGKYLMPFQTECLERMIVFLKERKAVYNACEPGLGKSVQTIAALNYFGFTSVLIIAPAVMRRVWLTELSKFSTLNSKLHRVVVLESSKDLKQENLENASIVITSYELASSEKAVLLFRQRKIPKPFECLVIDECFFLKNRKAKRTKAILNELWPHIEYKICLAGTPFTICSTDGYTMFNAIAPELFPNYWKFAQRYALEKRTPFGTIFYGAQRTEELSKLIRKNFFVRKTKEEALPDLPEKTWQEITLSEAYAVKSLPEFNDELSKVKIKSFEEAIAAGQTINEADPLIRSIRQAQGLKKLPPVIDFVKDLLEQEIPIVLFGYHKSHIAGLMEGLKEFNPVTVTGDTSAPERAVAIEAFQYGYTNLIILSIPAAGIGITLTRSSTCVFSELAYTPSSITQATDRLHRIGQKNAVQVYYFVVDQSLETRIIQVLVERAKAFKELLG